jgi:hypothetical protein
MGAVITRPFTFEPIQRSLQDALTDLTIELEEEGNLPEEVAEASIRTVADILIEQYGPRITREALLAVVQHFQESPPDVFGAFSVPLPVADQGDQRVRP